MSILSFIMLVILTMISALVKPVNFETSYIALFYFIVMATIFVGLISVTFGLIRLLTEKKYHILWGLCIVYLIVTNYFHTKSKSCIYQSHPMLNPMYYIVNGIAQSIIFVYQVWKTFHIILLYFILMFNSCSKFRISKVYDTRNL